MTRSEHPNRLRLVFVSWIVCLGASSFAALLTCAGQGVGAAIGGCDWIGLSAPVDRQPWALANQPSIAFASQPISLLYWLGGVFVCCVWVVLVIPVAPRPRKVIWELAAIQAAFTVAVVGLGWFPLVDLWDGHIARMLRLRQLPTALVWVIPVIGSWCALVPTTRLLALFRRSDRHLSRTGRLWAVLVHLVIPASLWIAAASFIRVRQIDHETPALTDLTQIMGSPLLPAAGSTMPLLAALLLAWFLFPRPWVQKVTPSTPAAVVLICVASALLVLTQWYVGGPAPENTRRGVLWSAPDSRNNIRPWINTEPASRTVTSNSTTERGPSTRTCVTIVAARQPTTGIGTSANHITKGVLR